MPPTPGQVINNKYRLLRLIGDGGMGSVYEARHEGLGTSVALKFLHPELAKKAGLAQRFMQEAKVSAQIQSDHVVRVMDVDETEGSAFIVMEYLEGRTLQTMYEELYQEGKRLSYEEALEFAMQMLEGVDAAHRAGVVHRDLKPDNVMITRGTRGRPLLKLLDFGIAKLRVSGDYEGSRNPGLTRPGVVMGTPEYMAPEQAYSADAVDERADVFSLGVIIFEMLAGRRPVGGEDPQEIAGAYLAGRVARLESLAPNVTPALASIIHRAMEPYAPSRWAKVSDLRDALEPFAFAVRVPSALMTSSSLSNHGLTPALPGTNIGTEPPRNVAKTLPPEEQPSSLPVRSERPTVPAEAPVFSSTPMREPTPLGGFSVHDLSGVSPGPVSGSESATASATPYVPSGVDPAATANATPIGVRASGEFLAAGGTVLPQNGLAIRGDRLSLSPVPVGKPNNPPERRGVLRSLPMIVLLALTVSAMVVGFVHLAHSRATVDDHIAPPAPPPPVTVVADPPVTLLPPSTIPSSVPSHVPTHVPPHVAPRPSSSVGPKGSSVPPTPPPPSASVPPPPSASAPPPPPPSASPRRLPPLAFPSDFPFDFPFPIRPRFEPRRRPPSDEPPRTDPESDPRNPYGYRRRQRLPPEDPYGPQPQRF